MGTKSRGAIAESQEWAAIVVRKLTASLDLYRLSNAIAFHQDLREEIVKDSVIDQAILEQGLQHGLQQGAQTGEATLVIRLLKHRFNDLGQEAETRIRSLSVDQLEVLGEALLDFTQREELLTWLTNNASLPQS